MLTIISSAHALNRLSLALDDVGRLNARENVLAAARRLMDVVLRWQERAGERRRLVDMDDRLLADIGISRSDALAEFDKPFWRI